MAILRRAVTLIMVMAVLTVACQPEGRVFQTTLPKGDKDPLPVTLIDETELVTGIAQAEVDGAWNDVMPAVHSLPNDPNAAVLSWTGGACDQDTTVRFHVLHGGYVLNVSTNGSAANCPASAVPHAIRIATSRQIPVDSIVAAGN